ncbi:hypothetical protein ACWGH8_22290 [Nonomuraea muscovyensis]|uniref:Uncharacterized protein n=1 Tax=Nonomuraea muscovyensis TaxID=1124761 RepID=A0A7X0C3Z7_9ACTN|nr:hypothetical protein [Nonomuraea muscovyensis]MBB6347025.1 hypothetical protein [Nonomuraea muscovyensis]
MNGASLAIRQRSLGDPSIGFPLWPPLVDGCLATSSGFKDLGVGQEGVEVRSGATVDDLL